MTDVPPPGVTGWLQVRELPLPRRGGGVEGPKIMKSTVSIFSCSFFLCLFFFYQGIHKLTEVEHSFCLEIPKVSDQKSAKLPLLARKWFYPEGMFYGSIYRLFILFINRVSRCWGGMAFIMSLTQKTAK